MKNIKKHLDQIGFSFTPQDEVERKASIHRKIAEIKSKQKKLETTVKLFKPENIEELKEVYRELNKQLIKLESEL